MNLIQKYELLNIYYELICDNTDITILGIYSSKKQIEKAIYLHISVIFSVVGEIYENYPE